MNQKDILINILKLLVENKVDFSHWKLINEYIDELYNNEAKKSTIEDTPKL